MTIGCRRLRFRWLFYKISNDVKWTDGFSINRWTFKNQFFLKNLLQINLVSFQCYRMLKIQYVKSYNHHRKFVYWIFFSIKKSLSVLWFYISYKCHSFLSTEIYVDTMTLYAYNRQIRKKIFIIQSFYLIKMTGHLN